MALVKSGIYAIRVIAILELSVGINLGCGSQEITLRYVRVDVVAAWSSTDCQTRSRFSPRILRISASL